MLQLSVIIITYNRADLLPKAIASVLRQDYLDFELLIIDDCSSDNTEEVVSRLMTTDDRIKYLKNDTNLGISKSRNRGVALTQGTYIAMLDSDDYWLVSDKLSKQITYLNTHSEVSLIGSAIRLEDEKGKALKDDVFETDDINIRKKMLFKNQFAQSTVVFRKEVFNSLGGYSEESNIGEDYDLWLKIGKTHKLANLAEITTSYLIHSGGITKKKRLKTVVETDKIIRRYKNSYPGYLKARIKTILRLVKLLF